MKHLLIFLLLTTSAYSQQAGRIFQRCGAPASIPVGFSASKDILSDTCSGINYKIVAGKWQENTGIKKALGGVGVQGPVGPQGVQGPTGLTGPQGIQGVQGIPGPQGPKGDTGPSGSGGGTNQELPFYVVKAHGTAQTLQQAGIPITKYPGIDVTVNDMVDWANLQYAVKEQGGSSKQIILSANGNVNKLYLNRGIKKTKYAMILDINLGNCGLYATNSNPFAFFYSDFPTDMNDANIMAMSKWYVENGTMTGQGQKQVGIEMQSSYGSGAGSLVRQVEGVGLLELAHTYFSLKVTFDNCSATDCFNGIILDTYVGKVPGATAANSQSNCARINGFRYYGNSAMFAQIRAAYPDDIRHKLLQEYYQNDVNKALGIQQRVAVNQQAIDMMAFIQNLGSSQRVASGGVAIGNYGNSSVIIDGIICEGWSVSAVVDWDGMGATTVKDMVIRGYLHFECVNGVKTAIVNVSILGGNIVIENPINHYPGKLLSAGTSTGGGYMTADISGMNWYVPDAAGKFYRNTGNLGINLRNCENVGTSAQSLNMVEGVTTTACASETVGACGSNYIRVLQPRR